MTSIDKNAYFKDQNTNYKIIFNQALVGVCILSMNGEFLEINDEFARIIGYEKEELLTLSFRDITHPDDLHLDDEQRKRIISGEVDSFVIEKRYLHKQGYPVWIKLYAKVVSDSQGNWLYSIGFVTDISEHKRVNLELRRAREALEKQIYALMQPLEDPEKITFPDLFKMDDIQRLQDMFAEATSVASLITDPDGLPLTRPSNFTRLCSTIIRKTETGLHDCYLSDKEYGALQEEGPMVRTCLGCGLWDAGTPIYVGGKHLANWLVGQVRDETQTEEQMIEYANKIGADPDEFIKAFYEVPVMTHEKFIQIADTLFVFSRQLSNIAYQNIQQAKFILQRKTAEEALKKNQYILTKAQEIGRLGTWEFDLRTGVLIWTNQNYENFGVPLNTPLTYELFLNCVHPDDREFVDNSWEQALEGKPYDLEHRVLIGDEIRWLREKAEIIFDESGKAEVAIGFTQDVTQWKLTEIELNDYKNSLEDQVKRRTHELEMKNIELERYNRLFVGREFRIKELKDQVAELKRQLADRSNRQ